MRTIKFRAWDKKKKLMFDVLELQFMVMNSNGGVRKVIGNGINGGAPVVHDFELMQYTGLKDKNGKEIYEGDIVQMVDAFGKGRDELIKWDDEIMGFCPDYASGENSEVIGNIYENPSLLN
jgi:uncharacterized phage protein (TIGR01671 family)